MPAFDVLVTDVSAVKLQLIDWNDPASLDGNRPSRLNQLPGAPARMTRAIVGKPVYLRAIYSAVTGPLDAALPANFAPGYFSAWIAEAPILPWGFTFVAGRSSLQWFTPPVAGKYTLGMSLANGGGAWILHVDAQ